MLIIACDYDSTLVFNNAYGETIGYNEPLIDTLKEMKERGHKLILFTCREGAFLKEAIRDMRMKGLTFDAINENLEEEKEKGRKPKFDILIDDRAIPPHSYLSTDYLEKYTEEIKKGNTFKSKSDLKRIQIQKGKK